MALQKNKTKDAYEYTYERQKKDGTSRIVTIKVPKVKVVKREKINQFKDGNTYVYKYKTTYDNGDVKIITMKRKYNPKKKSDDEEEKK